MITDRVKALFEFVGFLHSNIEKFKQFDGVVNELSLLAEQRSRLSPTKNFVDKLRYDEVQAEWNQKSNVISENITKPIFAKALELNICDSNYIMTLWNWNISEVVGLTRSFSKDDVPEIFLCKAKYCEFKTRANYTYFNAIFFDNLDQVLNVLFDFFEEGGESKLEASETKAIEINSTRERVEQKLQSKIDHEEIEIEDADEFFKIITATEREKEKRRMEGFAEMEKYILENVHEDVRADLERLKQLRRNLLNWKGQLTVLFIEPENQVHNDPQYFNLMKLQAERMVRKISAALEIIDARIEHKQSLQLSVGKEIKYDSTLAIKPIFKPELLDVVFDILKDFFSQEQKPILKELLQTGNKAGEHLIFWDNGNRLADAFKQLKKADIISGCEQKELEKWISENFKFRFRQKIRDFKLKYLNDIISTNKDFCSKPLLNVSYEKGTGKVLITKA